MKQLIFLALCTISVAISSCGKKAQQFKIAETTKNVDESIPDDFKHRSLFHDVSIIQYNLSNITGWILRMDQSNGRWKRITQLLPEGYKLEDKIISDGKFFESIVTKKASAEGNVGIPILAVTAAVNDSTTMELMITDELRLEIESTKIPWALINDYVKKNPNSANTPRVWVQGAMLTRQYYKTSRRTKSTGTASGSVFNVKGNYYSSNSTYTRTPYICMLLIDLDEIEKSIKNNEELNLTWPGKSPYRVLASDKNIVEIEN